MEPLPYRIPRGKTGGKPEDELEWFDIQLSSDFRELLLVYPSDVHRGDRYSMERSYMDIIEWLGSVPNAYSSWNGDLCNAILKGSPGNIYDQTYTPQQQRDYFVDTLAPIRHKIIGMSSGNHEERILNAVGIDITQDIADALEVPYVFEDIYYKISATLRVLVLPNPWLWICQNFRGQDGEG